MRPSSVVIGLLAALVLVVLALLASILHPADTDMQKLADKPLALIDQFLNSIEIITFRSISFRERRAVQPVP